VKLSVVIGHFVSIPLCLTLPPRMESLVSVLVYVQRRRTAASECMSGIYSDKNQ